MVHPSRSVPDGLPASPPALDQRNTSLTELALGVPQVLLGLRQHQLLGKHRLLADGASAQLRLLTTEHWPPPSVRQPPHWGGAGAGSKARSAVAEAGRR